MYGLWLEHILSLLHSDLFGETTINPQFPQTPDAQSFLRSLLIFGLAKSVDLEVEQNVLEWRGNGSEF